jgi:hypothetical protein
VVWVGFFWLRIGTSGRFYKHVTKTFGFHKMRRNICLCKELVSFSGMACSMELVTWLISKVAGKIVFLPR